MKKDGSTSILIFIYLEENQFWDSRYKRGTTLAAETDSSSVITVHVYYNGLFPNTMEIPSDVIKIMAVDTDQERALSDFNAGTVIISMTIQK